MATNNSSAAESRDGVATVGASKRHARCSQEMMEIFERKYGTAGQLGWGPRRRLQSGYFTPDDVYESVVHSLVNEETVWLDVGSGRDIFPSNFGTAKLLAGRCRTLVGVDPSENLLENKLVHERFQGPIEDFESDRRFDLLTLRMVAEHVTQPQRAAAALARNSKQGGRLVIYTVYKWSPVTIISSCVPFALHAGVKKILWNSEERDTFPACYKLNTRKTLRETLGRAGFAEEEFYYLDDCRSLGRWKLTHELELTIWKMLSLLKLHYPELCLLGVYRKCT
jgi:SAM-dependent methyltransferase